MNRRKSSRNLSFGSVLLLVVAAILIAAAGVFHACVKNRQVEVARSIEKTERRIDQLELDTKTLQMYLDRQLNRFIIRERLKQLGSDLITIEVKALEEVRPGETAEPLPDLAQSGP